MGVGGAQFTEMRRTASRGVSLLHTSLVIA